jgi:hypothetical protein
MTIDWNQFLASPVALIVSLILAVLLLGGCADPQQSQTAMDFLKQGQAQGTLTMTSGGSPLQVGSKQVFFVGPENASLNFHGEIDYRSADGRLTIVDVPAARPPEEGNGES